MKTPLRFSFTLGLLFIISPLVLTYAQSNQVQKTINRQPLKITLIGGSPNGVWHMVMNGVTECINRSYPGSNVTVMPGAAVANIFRINMNQADGGLTVSVNAAAADTGNEPFKEKLKNIAAIASLYPVDFQLVVNKSLGISSIEEIVNKKMKIRLSVDQVGSSAELTLRQILSEYGVTFEDIRQWGGQIIFRNMSDSADMLSSGMIDGFCTTTLSPAPPIQEAAINRNLVLLNINPKILNKLCKKYQYSKGNIPANTYKLNKTNLTTLASFCIVLVPKNIPDDISYKIARSINENLDYLHSVHISLKGLTTDNMATNLGVPLHKGAKEYYSELKAIK